MKSPQSEFGRDVLIACMLVALTFALFARVAAHDFINYDDPDYVTNNPHVQQGITWETVQWAFTATQPANWHPIAWLSHLLDFQLFGLNPAGHHLVSALIHALNAALLFAALRGLTGDRGCSALVAGLFAVHPLHVESVAWVAERKDVLSSLFWFATLAAYAWYVRKPAPARYMLVAIGLALGLMTKSMLVTLPFVLLLLDRWPLKRIDASNVFSPTAWRWLIVEKIPLFALSAACSVMTISTQRGEGALISLEHIPYWARIANACDAYTAYLLKTIWPAGLSVFYPHPGTDISLWRAGFAALFLAVCTIAVLLRVRKQPYLAVGWFWYLGVLAPVIGVVQAGTQSMADRYTYVPLVGIFIAVTWGLDELAHSKQARARLTAAGMACLAALSVCTWFQLGHWQNNDTLFTHAIANTERNALAHNNLGFEYLKRGDNAAALELFRRAVEYAPNWDQPHGNLATALLELGDAEAAVEQAARAYRLVDGGSAAPPEAQALLYVARFYSERNDMTSAIPYAVRATAIAPQWLDGRVFLGETLLASGRVNEAIEQLAKAQHLDPSDTRTLNSLGVAYLKRGEPAEAELVLREAIELEPTNPEFLHHAGLAKLAQGDTQGAVRRFEAALQQDPAYEPAQRQLELIRPQATSTPFDP